MFVRPDSNTEECFQNEWGHQDLELGLHKEAVQTVRGSQREVLRPAAAAAAPGRLLDRQSLRLRPTELTILQGGLAMCCNKPSR